MARSKLTLSQRIIVHQLQQRGAWLRVGPSATGVPDRGMLMRSRTEELDTVDMRVVRNLLAAGVIKQTATIQTDRQRRPRLCYRLTKEYRDVSDHH